MKRDVDVNERTRVIILITNYSNEELIGVINKYFANFVSIYVFSCNFLTLAT